MFHIYCLKTTECNSHETHIKYPNSNSVLLNAVPLNDQQQFNVNKINKIKNYFASEIKKRELMSKRLSKYIASFDYFDKSLIVSSVKTGRIYLASFETIIGAHVRIAKTSLSLALSVFTGNVEKLLKTTRNKNKKRNKIVILAGSKLNSIESKIYEALINNENSQEDVMAIINEETKTSRIKRKGQNDELLRN